VREHEECYLFGWFVVVMCNECRAHLEYYVVPGLRPTTEGGPHEPRALRPCNPCQVENDRQAQLRHKSLWERQRAHVRR
jgi:hypothetical protein